MENLKNKELNERQILERIEIIEGDITQLDVDAIVNAANESLIAGGVKIKITCFFLAVFFITNTKVSRLIKA